ncbi:hypothetical protein [Streptomyces justiciae]|uniref:hypothetical protein n=1 Tax=Streptomyces justiciae TaxID=2780140 RepID=UPI00211851C5|nr:hypothetical protein [Streptomyces justiciae]MCW8383954.1 hypothetical protein [Streptomyces justiciae]
MILDGLDQVLAESSRPASQPEPERRFRFGWRQVTAQIAYVVFWAVVVGLLLSWPP